MTNTRMRTLPWAGLAFTVALISACSREQSPSPERMEAETTARPGPQTQVRIFAPSSIARGANLFEQHCALCHGPQAQGHPDWQTPSEGKFAAAPPLDGTGNDWKRSKSQMVAVIKNGVRRANGDVIMPGWKDRLSEAEIEDIITWYQSLWPPEIYDKWYKAQSAPLAPPG